MIYLQFAFLDDTASEIREVVINGIVNINGRP